MTIVQRWSGRETRALREALRMTVIEFAEYLGVTDRTVSKWEAGGAARVPLPAIQQVLDTALRMCALDVQTRFAVSLGEQIGVAASDRGEDLFKVTSHKFIPQYVGVEAVELLADRPEFVSTDVGWIACWRAEPAVESGGCRLYAFACGVVVAHLHQVLELPSVTDLAVWRYVSYQTDLPWLTKLMASLVGVVPAEPEYVLSAYVLESPKWDAQELDVALRLMCTPSVLVDRSDLARPRAAAPEVELSLLRSGFSFPDVANFGVSGVSIGYAGWSGISYFPMSTERALPADSIVTCQLIVQMLWCYSRHILRTIEEGKDPQVPEEFGWRFLRAARTRLTTARSQETSQHSLMRTAILDTSELPRRLAEAQEALRHSAG
jgi:transcriptional regulator with XRE-family HTH domain